MAYLWGKPQESPAGAPEQSVPQSPFRLLKQVLTPEQCRTVVEWVADNVKAKEAAGIELPALPDGELES